MGLLRIFPARARQLRLDLLTHTCSGSGGTLVELQDAAGGEGISHEGRRKSRLSVGALMRTASAAFLLKRLPVVMFRDNAARRWSGKSIQACLHPFSIL